tara:strand:- start:302 stop:547 length:246 start_codon:yes stop_codon:yes gene_type:complete
MSSELHKYIETAIEKKENLLNAEVITFPTEKKDDGLNNIETNTYGFWKINDKTNEDQLRAVTGICFMFVTLFLIGLYSNLS